jgi:hypothetical protein
VQPGDGPIQFCVTDNASVDQEYGIQEIIAKTASALEQVRVAFMARHQSNDVASH